MGVLKVETRLFSNVRSLFSLFDGQRLADLDCKSVISYPADKFPSVLILVYYIYIYYILHPQPFMGSLILELFANFAINGKWA